MINPHDVEINDIVKVYIEYWKFIDVEQFNGDDNSTEVTDEKNRQCFKIAN
ncbi:conserved hypothetical protein [Thermoanaerobacterium thermosaccharolyticum DSM 571]|uniref:Uncharacterized protein n=1 Tax=Thermoanaerobacterium thermosaccharolyticum (strain ATCC 7956 / DSM 571 / NCIMB 9385 / NCA 3814 / NCTC 13789 / WDCM 00135 / 2032) TaxID=580327 RepID=D9TQI0_THETC|nr:hypothetical protein [Thermoanaerobacterium thermosaccharolyticum]ADL69214.1 conserved hypothetical protein [Thermoanaerobacterium thermosaccharolyticum DSM 571]